ncbi:MAG: hypothetical protein KIS85_06245 [Anaerolineales bacterium]|nr:hypothetical protein [Anaerolineales bacterium]
MASQRDLIARIQATLWGNGRAGLVTRMELVESKLTEITWWVRSLGVAVILWVLNQVLGIVGGG